jgi:hypothetical protein
MVASDTIVGIVGATILVVALAGVFIYESNQPAPETTVPAQQYLVNATGTATFTEADAGTPLPTDDVAASSDVTMQVSNLPVLRGGELYYAAFLVHGSDDVLLMDTLEAAANRYTLQWEDDEYYDGTAVRVSLETTSNPSAPALLLFEAPIDAGSISASNNLTLASSADATTSLSVSKSGGSTSVAGTLEDLQAYDGLMYRVWLREESGAGARFVAVANISMPQGVNGTFDHELETTTVAGDGWNRIEISLEKAGSTQSFRGGFPVYVRDL